MRLNEIRFSFTTGTVHWIFDDTHAPYYRVIIHCLDSEKMFITDKQPTIVNSRKLLLKTRIEIGSAKLTKPDQITETDRKESVY